ncbi:hypothetical protein RU07_17800 [Agrobacterium tumefaciens]|uniref:Uncharacterized protein n=1 Tax=Agrobacterium tumefaciens TaxID=358 RepID=A0A0D0JWD0_AGRTU|nr:hypothetical protein RU07_17800 [Agrobacterium tumefaciens]
MSRTFQSFEESKQDHEAVTREQNDAYRQKEKSNQEKLTGENRSAMQDGIAESDSAASSAVSEAESAWQAKFVSVEAEHQRETSAGEATPPPMDRKAAYLAVRERQEKSVSQEKGFDRAEAYRTARDSERSADGQERGTGDRDDRFDR